MIRFFARFCIRLFVFLAGLLCSRLAYSEGSPAVRYLGIEQGLSNNAVTSIYQDANGFMWFGTYDGLNRYDGYGFKTFRNVIGNNTSLGDNHVRAIEGDAAHKLWIGSEKSLSIYNPVKAGFFSPQFKPWNEPNRRLFNDGVFALSYLPAADAMLVGTQHNGLLLFENGEETGLQIPLPDKKKPYSVSAIAFDATQKKALVFIPGTGLYSFEVKTKTLRLVTAAIRQADCLRVDSKGQLWLGNENGLFRFDESTTLFSKNVLPSVYKVVSLFEDRQGTLWMASDGGGLWTMPAGSNTPAPYLSGNGTQGINSNAVYAVYEDKEGSKWIGTLRGGINLIQSQKTAFTNIEYKTFGQNNFNNNFILSFCEDDKGNVWIGSDGAGLRYWDRGKNTFTTFVHDATAASSISSNFVPNLLIDAGGDLWIATWFGGVNRLKKGSRNFEHFVCYNPTTGLAENNAWLLHLDAEGRLWASTTNDGHLYLFNRPSNHFELFNESLVNIQTLLEDKEGGFWAGNYTSLNKVDRESKTYQTYPMDHTVRCLYEDRRKSFWVGTDGGGLLLFDRASGKYQRFTTTEGLPSNTILRILEDAGGNLWLSTYNGLCKFNPVNKTVRNFSPSDGLQSNQFSFNAALALHSGEFLFGGIKGFNIFYPDSVYDKQGPPGVFLTGLKVANKPIEEDVTLVTKRSYEKIESIELPYNQAILSLDFVALEYSSADKIRYAYKLEGWDKTWNYVNDVRTANYSRLEEGSYVFKLKVTNAAGIWSDEKTLLKIVVLPPWYRAWWAYLIYACAVASLIYFYVAYSNRQERLKYEIKLAQLEKEKEKELTERKLSFFTNVSHEFRTPLTLIINPIKDLLRKADEPESQKELNIVHRNARRLLSLVDQLLLFRRADTEAGNLKFAEQNFYTLCHEVYLCFVQQAKINGQDYFFEFENKCLRLYVDRQKMEIALYNLLSNAIKYTPNGGKIIFRITENTDDVQVAVIDNGPGIPAAAAPKLFEKFYQASAQTAASKTGFGIGLYLVKNFVEGHKGKVSFQSSEGEGTSFFIELKKGTAHLAGQILLNAPQSAPVMLEELAGESTPTNETAKKETGLEEVVSDRHTVLVVDDNQQIREYLRDILTEKYVVAEAVDGAEAWALVQKTYPDLVISDIRMGGLDGIALCKKIKGEPSLTHIPVVLLTGSYGPEVELQSVEGGADIYITKPFDKDLLLAKVDNLFKNRTELQNYFFNEITLKKNNHKISPEFKEFLHRCIAIVESHLGNDDFNIKVLAKEIGMSHSALYKRVRAISGQSVSAFIRYIRLRKAAELLLKGDCNVNQAAFQVGIADVKYFRAQFNKLFGMNPSDYMKKYRQPFNETYQLTPNAIKEK